MSFAIPMSIPSWMVHYERLKRIAEARHHLATIPDASDRLETVARLYGITVEELTGGEP